jgi:hypothetical protein
MVVVRWRLCVFVRNSAAAHFPSQLLARAPATPHARAVREPAHSNMSTCSACTCACTCTCTCACGTLAVKPPPSSRPPAVPPLPAPPHALSLRLGIAALLLPATWAVRLRPAACSAQAAGDAPRSHNQSVAGAAGAAGAAAARSHPLPVEAGTAEARPAQYRPRPATTTRRPRPLRVSRRAQPQDQRTIARASPSIWARARGSHGEPTRHRVRNPYMHMHMHMHMHMMHIQHMSVSF